VEKFELDGSEDYLVVACDGLWDVMTPEEVKGFLDGYKGRRKEGMVDSLVQKARSLGSTDNITAVVVVFS